MKKIFVSIILMIFVSIYAQIDRNENFKHFEIDASIMLWSPTSMSIQSTNSVTQYAYPDGSYQSTGGVTGYGASITPCLNATYYFNNNLGVSLGFSLINMDNELSFQASDSTFQSYENMATISQFTLGVAGKINNSQALELYYGLGVDFVANYDLEIKYSDESTVPDDLEANDIALGLYFRTGMKIKLYKFISLKAGLEYSFVPAEIEYTNNDGSAKINEITNFGGIGLQTGLSFDF